MHGLPRTQSDRGALGRALSAALFAMALLGFLSAPLARVVESTPRHVALDAAGQVCEAGQDRPARLSNETTPRRLSPGQAAETLLEDFEIEERGDDDGEHDQLALPHAPMLACHVSVEQKQAIPSPVSATPVPFRHRAFSSRAPPIAA